MREKKLTGEAKGQFLQTLLRRSPETCLEAALMERAGRSGTRHTHPLKECDTGHILEALQAYFLQKKGGRNENGREIQLASS